MFGERYRVVRSDNGPAALDALRELTLRGEATAVILSDYRMPGMTGVDFLERAMDLVPRAKRVLLTAYADTDAAIRAINEVDLDHYLLKPWDPPEERLYPVLDELLEEWARQAPPGFDDVTLLGHQWSARTQELEEFLARNQVPYRRLREEDAADVTRAAGLGEADLPAVVLPDGTVLRQPELREVADRCGLATTAGSPLYDVVVIGGGPAGLGAAVYAGSEGLLTLLDRDGRPPASWPLSRTPYHLESSVPGVFVAGDVRSESVKRVASAVGEGAMAISLVHRYLEAR